MHIGDGWLVSSSPYRARTNGLCRGPSLVAFAERRVSQAEEASPADSEVLGTAATLCKDVLSMLSGVIGLTGEHVYRCLSTFVRFSQVCLPAAVARKIWCAVPRFRWLAF